MSESDSGVPKVRRSKWSRIWRWSCLLLVAAGLGITVWSNVHQSMTMKAIDSVGGSLFDPRDDGSLSYRLQVVLRTALRDPFPRDLFLSPQFDPATSPERFDDERLQDEAILQINLSEIGHLRIVEMSGPHVTDRGFAHLAGNPLVHNVNCRRAKITDAGLAAIQNNLSLFQLDISGNDITDRGMRSLAKISSLSGISLRDTLITDEGLRDLTANRTKLWSLSLGSTDVTGEGLGCLVTLPRLIGIHLDVLQCTGSGIAHLQSGALPLETLGVRMCSARKQTRLRAAGIEDMGQIDDELVARISRIKSLKRISLNGNSASDQSSLTPAVLRSLKSMPALTELSTTDIGVDPEVIRQIRREIPTLTLTIQNAQVN